MRIFAVAVMPLLAAGLVVRAIQPAEEAPRTVFSEPALRLQAAQLQQQLVERATSGQLPQALELAHQLVQLLPQDAAVWYNLACLQAVTGQRQPAVTALRRAVELGFRDPVQLQQDADLQTLRDDPAFADILRAAGQPFQPPAGHPEQPPVPGPIRDGVALVTEDNTRWDNRRGVLVSVFEPAVAVAGVPAVRGSSPAETQVQAWYAAGAAAGHVGDLYDNRDRDHSPLNLQKFPQLTRIEYGPAAQQVRADWGVQIQHLFDRPVLGNSSTADVSAHFWRSNPRMFLLHDVQARRVYNQYVSNQLYVYPEHNDYDPERGDVYPANTPWCVISQGSSGSDQPFLEALALTMAAFRPEVKRRLVDSGLLMPTMQAVLRRSLQTVVSDEDYLSGKAHPVVFRSEELDPLRMVERAQQLQVDCLPPMVQLQVTQEELGVPGRDYFFPEPAERLFDTPVAVARVYRTVAGKRRMLVDASASRDLHGRPLKFRWVLLQGDPSRVEIRPQNSVGSAAEIILHWHPQAPVATRPELRSSRVDIGVFASNGSEWSAPAFVTSFSLANELREYDPQGRILAVDYADPVVSQNYVEPLLDLPRRWRDAYHYATDGSLTGWTRTLPSGDQLEFHVDGTVVDRRDALGRVQQSREVRYVMETHNPQPPTLGMQITAQRVHYEYASDDDRVGTPVRQP